MAETISTPENWIFGAFFRARFASFALLSSLLCISLSTAVWVWTAKVSLKKEETVPLNGELDKMKIKGDGDAFEFTVTGLSPTFVIEGLSGGDRMLLANTEHRHTRFKFTVERRILEAGGHDPIPVKSLSSPKNVYLQEEDLAAQFAKIRIFALFTLGCGLITSVWILIQLFFEFCKPIPERRKGAREEPGVDFLLGSVLSQPAVYLAVSAFVFSILAFPILEPVYWGPTAAVFFLIYYPVALVAFRRRVLTKPWAIAYLSSESERQAKLLHRPAVSKKQYMKAVATLVKSGRSVNIQDAKGRAPLHIAAAAGQAEAISLLLQHGADPNLCDAEGNTPVLLVVKAGSLGGMERLIAAGGSFLRANDAGVTPVALSEKDRKARPLHEILVRLVAQQSILITAAKAGDVEAIARSVGSGARLQVPADSGHTALALAIRGKHLEATKRLIQLGAKVQEVEVLVAEETADPALIELVKSHGPKKPTQT